MIDLIDKLSDSAFWFALVFAAIDAVVYNGFARNPDERRTPTWLSVTMTVMLIVMVLGLVIVKLATIWGYC